MSKAYVLNRETGKIELEFDYDEYKALSLEQQRELKRFYLFSRYSKKWVSKSSNNHFVAIRIAERLGFTNGGKIGERLSFAEQMERKAERAERRAERYEQCAENAEQRAERLQAEMNEQLEKGDNSFFTQPIIKGHAGSERFAKQRQKIYDRYHKGFEEYRKSEYFKERAETARQTASMEKLKDRTYLNNRIEECHKNIRKLEKYIIRAENSNNEKWLTDLLERMESEIDKLAYFQNALDDLGGVQYDKDNIKPGYLVKVRGDWARVVKVNPKTVEVQFNHVNYALKYAYAEIEEMKVPDNWTEPKKETLKNPFIAGDIFARKNIIGDTYVAAYQVIKTTTKGVVIQKIKIEDGKPVKDTFISNKQERRQLKTDRHGNHVIIDGDWYLYHYKPE